MASASSNPDLDRPLTPRAQDVVAAAKTEFAAHGYSGATTDAIARRAGVSQPYVVRLFGSKERLFLRCARDAQQAAVGAFRSAIVATSERPVSPVALGAAYQDLLENPETLQLLVQQNTMGQHPTIGEHVRTWFLEMYAVIRHEAGLPEEMARVFFSRGMLINTLLSLGLAPLTQDAQELLRYLAPAGQRPATGS